MRKSEEMRNPLSCFSRATPQTLMMILLDWDASTPDTIRFWCFDRVKRGLNVENDAQIVEARNLANEIEKNLPAIREARKKATLNPQAAWPFPK